MEFETKCSCFIGRRNPKAVRVGLGRMEADTYLTTVS